MIFSRTALALLGLAVAGCDFGPKVWIEAVQPQERIDATELKRVTCETHNGSVEIVGDPTISEVVIDVRKRAGGADEVDAQAAMDDLVVVREVRDGEW